MNNKRKLIVVPLLLTIFLLNGCIDTSKPKVGEKELDFGSPYSTGSSRIEFLINYTVSVPINNTRDSKVKIRVLEAKQVVNYEDGRREVIHGNANLVEIPPHEKEELKVDFKGVPVKYGIESNPLKLDSLVKSYKIRVEYKATTKVFFGLIPWSKKGSYEKVIKPEGGKINISQFIGDQFNIK